MKRMLLIFTFSTLIFQVALAQKFAFIDTDYILNQMPEYTKAQKDLDDLAEKWQKEIETNYAKVSEMYQKYQAESVLLPDDIKRKREEDSAQSKRTKNESF